MMVGGVAICTSAYLFHAVVRLVPAIASICSSVVKKDVIVLEVTRFNG